jgi:hypothetical protein
LSTPICKTLFTVPRIPPPPALENPSFDWHAHDEYAFVFVRHGLVPLLPRPPPPPTAAAAAALPVIVVFTLVCPAEIGSVGKEGVKGHDKKLWWSGGGWLFARKGREQ